MKKEDFDKIILPLGLLNKDQREFITLTIKANFSRWQSKQSFDESGVNVSFISDEGLKDIKFREYEKGVLDGLKIKNGHCL